MTESVPSEKSSFGYRLSLGWREAVIFVIGGVSALLCVVAPGLPADWFPLRVGCAVLLGDLTLVWALGRGPRSEDTFEHHLLGWFRESKCDLAVPDIRRLSGTGRDSPYPGIAHDASNDVGSFYPGSAPRRTIPPVQANPYILLQALSIAALVLLIAWLITGGTQEIIRWFRFSLR
jgi:hypothetical protein